MAQTYFTTETFAFLKDLKSNNTRDWFNENKPRYQKHVMEPAVRFVTDFAPHLAKVSSRFRADPRPIGGSIFRIYRDTRFAKDKSPYKTQLGIHFRHESAKDAYAPGFYLHIEPGSVFVGLGIWHPDATTLNKIRDRIVDDPTGWKRASNGKKFRDQFELAGDSLVRPPKGVDPEHPLIEDLKRKDYIAVAKLTQKAVLQPGVVGDFAAMCKTGAPLVKYICQALSIPY